MLLSSVAIGTACSAVNVGSEGSDCVLCRFLTGDPGVVIMVVIVLGGGDEGGIGRMWGKYVVLFDR